MNATAVDILDHAPRLALKNYTHIEVCGLVVETRGGVLTIRNINGRVLVQPEAANTIRIIAEERF